MTSIVPLRMATLAQVDDNFAAPLQASLLRGEALRCELTTTIAAPERGVPTFGAPADDIHSVPHHEGRVEADPKLPNDVLRCIPCRAALFQLVHKGLRAVQHSQHRRACAQA